MIFAVIKGDLVVNIIVAPDSFLNKKNLIKIESEDVICIGATYDKKTKTFKYDQKNSLENE